MGKNINMLILQHNIQKGKQEQDDIGEEKQSKPGEMFSYLRKRLQLNPG